MITSYLSNIGYTSNIINSNEQMKQKNYNWQLSLSSWLLKMYYGFIIPQPCDWRNINSPTPLGTIPMKL